MQELRARLQAVDMPCPMVVRTKVPRDLFHTPSVRAQTELVRQIGGRTALVCRELGYPELESVGVQEFTTDVWLEIYFKDIPTAKLLQEELGMADSTRWTREVTIAREGGYSVKMFSD